MADQTVQLGDKVRDKVSMIEGIVVGRTLWLHGCPRLIIQPVGKNKNGGPIDTFSIDEPSALVLKAKTVKEGDHKTGGPRTELAQRKTINRW